MAFAAFYFQCIRYFLKYSDRQALANSIDPGKTPRSVASDLDLYYLFLNKQF